MGDEDRDGDDNEQCEGSCCEGDTEPCPSFGVCTGSGQRSCNPTSGNYSGYASTPTQACNANHGPEVCDGVDNDCNGLADDGIFCPSCGPRNGLGAESPGCPACTDEPVDLIKER